MKEVQHIGHAIKKKRKELGLTQADVAGEFMSVSKLSNIENGKLLPDSRTWAYLKRKLKLGTGLEQQRRIARDLDLLLAEAKSYEKTKMLERAGKIYEKAARLAEKEMFFSTAARAYRKLSALAQQKGRWRDAEAYLKKAEKRLAEDDEEEKMKCRLMMGVLLEKMEKYDEARLLLLNGLKQFEEQLNDELRALFYYNLALVLYKMEKENDANYYCEKALTYSRKNSRTHAAGLLLQGILLKRRKIYVLAQERFEKVRQLAESFGDAAMIGKCWHNLAGLAAEKGNRELALRALHISKDIKRKEGDFVGLVRTHHLYARLLLQEGQLAEALKSATTALELVRKHRWKREELEVLCVLKDIHLKKHEPQKAFDFLFKAIVLAEELDLFMKKAEMLEEIASYYFTTGRRQQCLEKLYQAFLARSNTVQTSFQQAGGEVGT